MFYSHELLGRKTPLGAIWTLAHGRKLSKGKIISINVRELCDEIMQPGVPHSLRLQGILVGGVVLAFSKQQTYLLEDLQEMMRRVRAAATDASAAAAPKAEKGKGRGKGKQNADGKNQASLEAITLMDMEDLMAPAAYGDEDILGLLAGGSLSDALASQGAIPLERRGRDGGELDGDLFLMPSFGGGTTTSEGGDTDAQGGPFSKRSSRGTGSGSHQQQQEEVYGGAGLMQQDWLPMEEEVFADPDALDFDLLGGMPYLDLPQPPTGTSDRSRDQSSSQQRKSATSGDTTEGAVPAAGGRAAGEVEGDVPYEFDDQMFVVEDLPPEEEHPEQQESDQQQGRDQEDQGQKGGEQVRRAKQRKRKAGNVVSDDLDNLLIKNKVYREWCTDSSPLVNKQSRSSRTLQAHTHAAAPLTMQDHLAGIGFAAGVPLCAELMALFKAPAEAAAAAKRKTGAEKGRADQPSSPEVNNSTGEGSLPGMLPGSHKLPLDLHTLQPDHDEDMLLQQGDLAMPDDMNMLLDEPLQQHPVGPEEPDMMLASDELQDQLADLPFNGDIEVERMRAAATPGSSEGSLRDLLPGGPSTAQRTKGGQGSVVSSEGGSGLAAARAALARELGGTGTKRRLGSADLGTTDNLDIFFGTGNLADMLPDIEADQFYDDMQQQQQQPEEASTESQDAEHAGRAGSLAGSDRSLTFYSSSQFPLLEESEPDQPTQRAQSTTALSRTTRVALSIFQERLQRSADQLAVAGDGDSVNDAAGGAAGGAAADASVSFFGLIKEGRLSRNQAATLFYQVCVTTTGGFVSASQERAYGDITIKQGSRDAA